MVVVLAAPAADCAPLLVAELLCAIVEMAGGRGGWRLGGWGQEVSERVCGTLAVRVAAFTSGVAKMRPRLLTWRLTTMGACQ